MSRTSRGRTRKNQGVDANAEYSPPGDKIFILRVGTVTTLRTVVLVWLTSILSEYTHTLMIAEN